MTQLFIVTMILVSMAMSHNNCDLTKYIPGAHILVLPVEVVADLRAEVGRQVGVAAVQTVVNNHDPDRTRDMKLSDTWHDSDTRHVSSPDPGAGETRGPHGLHVQGDVREVVSEVARVVQVPLPTTIDYLLCFTSVAFFALSL